MNTSEQTFLRKLPGMVVVLAPRVAAPLASVETPAQRTFASPDADTKATLVIGDYQWPMPIPLVKTGSRWHFDARQGEKEILARRIRRHEPHGQLRRCSVQNNRGRETTALAAGMTTFSPDASWKRQRTVTSQQ